MSSVEGRSGPLVSQVSAYVEGEAAALRVQVGACRLVRLDAVRECLGLALGGEGRLSYAPGSSAWLAPAHPPPVPALRPVYAPTSLEHAGYRDLPEPLADALHGPCGRTHLNFSTP